MRWFDARQVVMGGGLVSGLALVIMSISSHFEVLYFAAVLSGISRWFMVKFSKRIRCSITLLHCFPIETDIV